MHAPPNNMCQRGIEKGTEAHGLYARAPACSGPHLFMVLLQDGSTRLIVGVALLQRLGPAAGGRAGQGGGAHRATHAGPGIIPTAQVRDRAHAACPPA